MKRTCGGSCLKNVLAVLAVGFLTLPVLVSGDAAVAEGENTAAVGVEEATPASWFNPGRISFGGRFSESTQEFVTDALIPVWKPGNAVLFGNLRGSFLEGAEQELNAGLVGRYLLMDERLILGLNTYYDTRWTDENNTFDQVGAGMEVLSKWVDFRANYYYPLTDKKTLNESTLTSGQISGDRLLTTTTRMQTYEEALDGFDVEVGVWLPYLSRCMPTALFVGVYDFSADYVKDLAGFRLRAESRLHPNITPARDRLMQHCCMKRSRGKLRSSCATTQGERYGLQARDRGRA